MRKKFFDLAIPAAALLVAVFCVGFLSGRSNISPLPTVHTQRTPPQSVSLSQQPTDTAPDDTASLLDLNTATAQQLEQLPGVGEVLANRIIDYRTLCGGFLTVDQLLEVEGIGEKKYAELREFITVVQQK